MVWDLGTQACGLMTKWEWNSLDVLFWGFTSEIKKKVELILIMVDSHRPSNTNLKWEKNRMKQGWNH